MRLKFAFLHLVQFGWSGPRQSKRGSRCSSRSHEYSVCSTLRGSGQQCTGGWTHSGGAVLLLALLAGWGTCKNHALQGLCFSPSFLFPKLILFIVNEKDAACLSYLQAVCYRAKNVPLHMPHRKNHRARFRIQRRKMLSKSQDQT